MRITWHNWGDHPLVTLITVLAGLAAIATFIRSCSTARIQVIDVDPCVEVIGRWDWLSSGGIVSIADGRPNIANGGVISWHQTSNSLTPGAVGSWNCDVESGQIELHWPDNFVDVLTLSDDGSRLSGRNNIGAAISGTRSR